MDSILTNQRAVVLSGIGGFAGLMIGDFNF
jgi:hypothetical protein